MAWPGARRTYQGAAGCGRAYDCAPEPWCAPAPPVPLAFPSGFAVMLPIGGLSPALPAPRLLPGAASMLPAGVTGDQIGAHQQTGYIPAWYGDSRIGRNPGGLAIGRGAIGYLRPYHGLLVLGGGGHGIGGFLIGTDAIAPPGRVLVEQPWPRQIEPPFSV